jgi:carbonic anhydrase
MLSPDANDPLLAGYRRFRANVWPGQAERFAHLARRRQQPATAVVACSDSRIDPQTIFDAEPGKLFVIRNVAGLVPPYAPDGGCHGTSAALEFAVKILKVRRIVLLGHGDCDGVHAMINGPLRNARDFLGPWMDIAEPVMWPMPDQASGQPLEAAIEDATIKLSLANLRTFPWIRDGEKAGQLSLVAWRFTLSTGELLAL